MRAGQHPWSIGSPTNGCECLDVSGVPTTRYQIGLVAIERLGNRDQIIRTISVTLCPCESPSSVLGLPEIICDRLEHGPFASYRRNQSHRAPACADVRKPEGRPRATPAASTQIRAQLLCASRRDGEHRVDYPKLPVGCVAELMCQTRAGESGSWLGIAPNEARALATALAIRPPIGMIGPSPAPLTPSGLLGEG
jgi:hypothetical protein